jgi:hypothetical protein
VLAGRIILLGTVPTMGLRLKRLVRSLAHTHSCRRLRPLWETLHRRRRVVRPMPLNCHDLGASNAGAQPTPPLAGIHVGRWR